jgi:hypothetical protein
MATLRSTTVHLLGWFQRRFRRPKHSTGLPPMGSYRSVATGLTQEAEMSKAGAVRASKYKYAWRATHEPNTAQHLHASVAPGCGCFKKLLTQNKSNQH